MRRTMEAFQIALESPAQHKAYATRVLESKDRIVTLDQNVEFLRRTRELEKQVKELEDKQKRLDAEDRERRKQLELETLADDTAAQPAP